MAVARSFTLYNIYFLCYIVKNDIHWNSIMRNYINAKYLLYSFLIMLVLGYLFPYQLSANNSIVIGVPFRFFQIYPQFADGGTLFSSSHLSIGAFLANIFFNYFVITTSCNLIQSLKKRKKNHDEID